MQPFKVEAIVLRRTNYGEADRILNLLTADRGTLSVIAKGARKPKSKLAGGLELFAVCDITVAMGRGDMGLVTSARIKEFYSNILKNYERTELAYLCIKQVNQAVQTVAEPEFYMLLRGSLHYLNDLAIDWRLIELWFRLNLKSLLGHGLNTAIDRSGSKLAEYQTYHYDFAEHAFYADKNGRFASQHLKVLRLAAVKNPAILQQVSGIEPLLGDCLWLAQQL